MSQPLKIENMTLLLELNDEKTKKSLWWKKTRHGTLICLKDYSSKTTIVNFLMDARPIRIEKICGGAPNYDLVREFESYN